MSDDGVVDYGSLGDNAFRGEYTINVTDNNGNRIPFEDIDLYSDNVNVTFVGQNDNPDFIAYANLVYVEGASNEANVRVRYVGSQYSNVDDIYFKFNIVPFKGLIPTLFSSDYEVRQVSRLGHVNTFEVTATAGAQFNCNILDYNYNEVMTDNVPLTDVTGYTYELLNEGEVNRYKFTRTSTDKNTYGFYAEYDDGTQGTTGAMRVVLNPLPTNSTGLNPELTYYAYGDDQPYGMTKQGQLEDDGTAVNYFTLGDTNQVYNDVQTAYGVKIKSNTGAVIPYSDLNVVSSNHNVTISDYGDNGIRLDLAFVEGQTSYTEIDISYNGTEFADIVTGTLKLKFDVVDYKGCTPVITTLDNVEVAPFTDRGTSYNYELNGAIGSQYKVKFLNKEGETIADNQLTFSTYAFSVEAQGNGEYILTRLNEAGEYQDYITVQFMDGALGTTGGADLYITGVIYNNDVTNIGLKFKQYDENGYSGGVVVSEQNLSPVNEDSGDPEIGTIGVVNIGNVTPGVGYSFEFFADGTENNELISIYKMLEMAVTSNISAWPINEVLLPNFTYGVTSDNTGFIRYKYTGTQYPNIQQLEIRFTVVDSSSEKLNVDLVYHGLGYNRGSKTLNADVDTDGYLNYGNLGDNKTLINNNYPYYEMIITDNNGNGIPYSDLSIVTNNPNVVVADSGLPGYMNIGITYDENGNNSSTLAITYTGSEYTGLEPVNIKFNIVEYKGINSVLTTTEGASVSEYPGATNGYTVVKDEGSQYLISFKDFNENVITEELTFDDIVGYSITPDVDNKYRLTRLIGDDGTSCYLLAAFQEAQGTVGSVKVRFM